MKRQRYFVRLNRFIGATDKRLDDNYPYEVIFPIWNPANQTFSAPEHIKDYTCGWSFRKYLIEGYAVLVNPNGGWNYLSRTDKILEFYSK